MFVNRTGPNALRRLLVPLFVLTALAPPAFAVTDEEIFRDFRFNFQNPGARALAMGGSFIAIANDATAAQANPARLGVLRLPEIFFEVRKRETQPSGAETGDFAIDPSVNPAATLNLTAAIEPESQTSPSNFSFVWPFRMKRALTLGISRTETLRVESTITNDFTETPLNASPFQDPMNPEQFSNSSVGAIDQSLVAWSLSAGYQLTRDLFVGGSIIAGELQIESEIVSQFSDPDGLFGLGGIDPRFQAFPPQQDLISTNIDDSDTDISWNIGLFWKLNDYVQFGTVYKKGLQMEVDETVVVTQSAVPLVGRTSEVLQTSFNVPDVAGFGVAYRPFAGRGAAAQNLLFAADVVRVENEDLVDGFVSQLNVITLPKQIQDIEFTADNTTEVHIGAEYYLPLGPTLLAFRLGFYTDPASNIYAENVISDGTPEQDGTKKAIENGELFPQREDETHFTAGIGFSYWDLEFAAAIDQSDIEDQYLFSVIYRFSR